MSNAQSLEAPGRKRPMIHITAQALGPPTFAVEISPPPPTNMPPLPFPPLQSVQTTKPPSMSSSPPALDNHSEDVVPSIKILSVKDPSDQGPSVNGPSVKGSSVKGSPVGKPLEKDPSANGPAATISDQPVFLSTGGVIVGGTTHLFSAVQSSVDSFQIPATGVSLCTAASGEKITVIGSLTLLACGKTAKVPDQAISMGANAMILASRTTDFVAFETTRLKSDNLTINGKSFSPTGTNQLQLQGEPHTPYASGFSLTSPIRGPSAPIILPTIIIISTQKFTAELSGKDLVGDKVTVCPATITGKMPVTASGASQDSTPVLGKVVMDTRNSSGRDSSSETATVVGNNHSHGKGNMAYTGRAARAFCNYSGWFVGGIAAWRVITLLS